MLTSKVYLRGRGCLNPRPSMSEHVLYIELCPVTLLFSRFIKLAMSFFTCTADSGLILNAAKKTSGGFSTLQVVHIYYYRLREHTEDATCVHRAPAFLKSSSPTLETVLERSTEPGGTRSAGARLRHDQAMARRCSPPHCGTNSWSPVKVRRSTPPSVMMATRHTPPDEPSRWMASDTAGTRRGEGRVMGHAGVTRGVRSGHGDGSDTDGTRG